MATNRNVPQSLRVTVKNGRNTVYTGSIITMSSYLKTLLSNEYLEQELKRCINDAINNGMVINSKNICTISVYDDEGVYLKKFSK